MKCTRIITIKGEVGPCGRETGKPCPPGWQKHVNFDPMVIRAFFDGLVTEAQLAELDAFVCSTCMPNWKAFLQRSERAKRRVSESKQTVEDYSI